MNTSCDANGLNGDCLKNAIERNKICVKSCSGINYSDNHLKHCMDVNTSCQ